jgi:hypothetical protein
VFVAGQGILVKQGEADVSFTAIGPGGLRIVGRTSDLGVADNGYWLTLTASLLKLDTGIPMRDAHMREQYLQVGRYPNAQLRVDRALLKFPDESGAEGTATGTMTIRGESRHVSLHYRAARVGAVLHITGEAQINMTDYGVHVPPYLGMTVKPYVALRVRFGVLES